MSATAVGRVQRMETSREAGRMVVRPTPTLDFALAALLVAWLALIGADRINLAGGATSFIATPFLVLTPIIVLVEVLRVAAGRRVLTIPANAVGYFLVASFFVCVVGVSAMFSADPVVAGRRTVLLGTQVFGTLLFVLILLNQRNPERILVRGAYLGLIVATIFSVAQVYLLLTNGWDPSIPESERFFNLAPRTYGIIPRLSGATIDQGRAGLLYVVYLYLVARFAKPSRLRSVMLFVGVVSLLGTLARAAILCAVVATAASWIQEKGVRLTWGRIFGVSALMAAVVTLLLASPLLLEAVGRTLEPVGERFSTREESAQMHFALIEHGLLVATSSLRNALIGVGYGNGWMVLEAFFPGDRFANFHSLYVTLLAESGVFALALGLVLLAYPFLGSRGPFVALIAGLLAYNVFYQSNTEPAFWLVLAFGWLTTASRREPALHLRTGVGGDDVLSLPSRLVEDHSGDRRLKPA